MALIITSYIKRIAWLLLPLILSLLVGALLILAVGQNPLSTYANLLESGFSCKAGQGRCALATALQLATPLILSGLSATVSLRGGFFSIGQAGQMLFGAAAASWLGGNISLPSVIHPTVALTGAALLGGLWGLVPALLKNFVGVNEIISTLLFNPIATVMVGLVWLPGVEVSARLSPLLPSTKLTSGIFIALAASMLIYLFLWHTKHGMEMRANANAPRFALYGGMPAHKPILVTMALSGALAGLAGGVEVLGVHYQFVSNFSAVNDFDGLIVAFAGGLHPAGVVLLAFLLGGLRTGSLVGLQILSGIPRELSGVLIAFILIFVSTNQFLRNNGQNVNQYMAGMSSK